MNRSNKLSAGFLFFFLLILSIDSFAAKLHGQITDENNQPLPYAIVYISGTSNGTTANSVGDYSLELPNGAYEISFRMIGYGLIKKQITISDSPLELNIQLKSESVNLKEVTIKANAEDPAYTIIRAAQKKRKFYKDQVKVYSANAYVKSTQQLTDHPKKFFGQDVDLGDVMDTATKIFYLSESVSELLFEFPDKYKEKMISSKVSGSPKTYSFNQATGVLISFYDNLVGLGELTPRGIVSPIASNAFLYYKYRLEGTFTENGVLVNKISVIPKRITDPVFRGTIYIAEDTWRIFSSDLFITKDQQMEFVDTFRIKQNYIKVDDETWMPFSHQFEYSFGLFGFKGNGVVLGIFSDYNLKPDVNAFSFRRGEIMKVDASANKKDSAYWTTTRPVPLTNLETTDYHRRDSTLELRESKPFLDSIDRKSNKFTFSDAVMGYSHENSYRNISYDISSPITNIAFNTIEGWNTGIDGTFRKGFGKEDRRYYNIKPSIRYGFSNGHLNGHVAFRYLYNRHRNSLLETDMGTDFVQFNPGKPISELVNTMYSLLAEKNYLKAYEKRYINAYHRTEIFNGLSFRIGAEYAHRISLSNSSDYSFNDVDGREYTSNDPYNPATDSVRFPSNDITLAEISLTYKPGQKYVTRPEGKINFGSKWPTFRVGYKKTIQVFGSDVDFEQFQASMEDEMNLGIIGQLKYKVVYGDFLSDEKIYSPDYKHFNGNKTWFSDFRIDDFKYLDYYTYSTVGPYIEVHGEENFGGFILNKIPLIRKLKFQEIAGVHYLHTNVLDNYFEFSIGIEKLGFMRAELFTSWKNGDKGTVGFLIGFKQSIGN